MKIGAIISAATIFIAGSTLATASSLPSYLMTSGTQILTGAGKPIRFKGVNLGGWLYPEPWMWGTFYFGNYEAGQGETDVLTNYLAANLTPDQIATFWNNYRTNFVPDADIAYIADHGWNCVRVPMDFRLFIDPG